MTRKYGVTGLGLALSKSPANLLGGDVILKHSVLGAGSTFLFTIISKQHLALSVKANHQRPANSGISGSTPNTLSGVYILLVEDSADNRELISLYLKRHGAKLEIAVDGAVSLKQLEGITI